jgi:hypothetical protein
MTYSLGDVASPWNVHMYFYYSIYDTYMSFEIELGSKVRATF